MKITDFVNTGEYLKKEDLEKPVLATISGASIEAIGEEKESKLVIHFKEDIKSLVANKTNLQLMAALFQSDDTDNWLGRKIVLYNDPTIMFGGKVVGGVRVRMPQQPDPAPAEDFDDDVPF